MILSKLLYLITQAVVNGGDDSLKRVPNFLIMILSVVLILLVTRYSPTNTVLAQGPSDVATLTRTIEDLDSRVERQRQELQTLQELVAKNGPAIAKIGQDITNVQTQAFSQIDRLVPVGTILPYYGKLDSLPSNWVPCDGRDSPGLPYPWTKVPDLRQRFLRGARDGAGVESSLGGSGGLDFVPDHQHRVSGSSDDVSFPLKSVNSWANSMGTYGDWHSSLVPPNTFQMENRTDFAALSVPYTPTPGIIAESHGHTGGSATFVGQSSSDGGHDNRPPFTSVHFIVRVK